MNGIPLVCIPYEARCRAHSVCQHRRTRCVWCDPLLWCLATIHS